MPDLETYQREICSSDRFERWKQRLINHPADDEVRGEVMREVATFVQEAGDDLSEQEREKLKNTVIRRLPQAAKPDDPHRIEPFDGSRAELDDLVVHRFPGPIASSYRRLEDAASPSLRLRGLIDTFESVLHYGATVVLSTYWRDGESDADLNRELVRRFEKSNWSTGDLLFLFRETSRRFADRPEALPHPELARYLFSSGGKQTESCRTLADFVSLRNDEWGHTSNMTAERCRTAFETWQPKLARELRLLSFLAKRELWRPRAISDDGVVTQADKLNGERIRRGRDVSLQLRVQPGNGPADVVPERSLLLVDEEADAYAHLSPFAAFLPIEDDAGEKQGEGAFLLMSRKWSGRALKQATFHTYREGPTDRCTVESRRVLERLERFIEEIRSSDSAEEADQPERKPSPQESLQEVPPPDHDLPQVWAEQEHHVQRFVGRKARLDELEDWASTPGASACRLVHGEPGLGKSALLSKLSRRLGARQEGEVASEEGPACLLHMVKSHKSPRRILQFLIWQADQFSSDSTSPNDYEGNVEDLRNVLLGRLGKLADTRGGAVLIVDALDELDQPAEDLGFLPEPLPEKGVRILLSSRSDRAIRRALRLRFSGLEETTLDEFGDVRALFVQKIGKDKADAVLQRVDVQALRERTEGVPLLLRSAAETLAASPDATLADVASTFEGVFEETYHEIAGKPSPDEAGEERAQIAKLLAVARDPLSASDLQSLLRVQGTVLTLEAVRDRLETMSEYLQGPERRWALYHEGLPEYLHERVLGARGVAELHDLFARWLDAPPQRHEAYRFEHASFHLLRRARACHDAFDPEGTRESWQRLEALLTDFSFIEDAASAGFASELPRAYAAALRDAARLEQTVSDDLHAFRQFVTLEAPRCDGHPKQFRQQALLRSKGHPVAEAAEREAEASGGTHLWPEERGTWQGLSGQRVLLGHGPPVEAVNALHGDGQVLVERNDGLHLVNDNTRASRRTDAKGHFCGLAADGSVVLLSEAGLSVWDAELRECLAHRPAPEEVKYTSASPSPGGAHVAASTSEHVFYVWDWKRDDVAATLSPTPSELQDDDAPTKGFSNRSDPAHFQWSADGKRLFVFHDASFTVDLSHRDPPAMPTYSVGNVLVWNWRNGEVEASKASAEGFPNGSNGVVIPNAHSFAFSEGNFLSGSYFPKPTLWNWKRQEELSLPLQQYRALPSAASADGEILITSGCELDEEGEPDAGKLSVRLWNWREGREVARHERTFFLRLEKSHLVLYHDAGAIVVRPLEAPTEGFATRKPLEALVEGSMTMFPPPSPEDQLFALFSDCEAIASGDQSGVVRRHSLRPEAEVLEEASAEQEAAADEPKEEDVLQESAVAYHRTPDGRGIWYIPEADPEQVMWQDVEGGSPVKLFRVDRTSHLEASVSSETASGRTFEDPPDIRLIAGGNGRHLAVAEVLRAGNWEGAGLTSGKEHHFGAYVRSLDSNQLVGQFVASDRLLDGWLTADGNFLVGKLGNTFVNLAPRTGVAIWDVRRGEEIAFYKTESAPDVFRDEGETGYLFMAQGSMRKSATLTRWNWMSGEEEAQLELSSRVSKFLALHDGRYAIGTEAGHVLLWDGQRASARQVLHRGSEAVTALKEAPDDVLLVGFESGRFLVWDLKAEAVRAEAQLDHPIRSCATQDDKIRIEHEEGKHSFVLR